VLTADQHDEFRATGMLRLAGAFPETAAEAICGRLWEFLASQHAIHRGEPSTWTVEYPARFQPVTRTGEPGDVILMHSDTFHAAAPNRLTEPRMMLTEMISPSYSCRISGSTA
jgi:hypothetical protein